MLCGCLASPINMTLCKFPSFGTCEDNSLETFDRWSLGPRGVERLAGDPQ